MKADMRILVILSTFLLAAAPVASAGRTISVDADVGPGGDGLSWATAFKYLQDALAAADANDEIRVARGTYIPDQNSVNPDGSGDRNATFQLISGVAIYGGFAGYGEADPNGRDGNAYETILSGDLNGDDGPDFANNEENTCHIITGSGTEETAILDGFIISGGKADRSCSAFYGGGMYNDSGSPTVTDCIFIENAGTGMYNYNSSPIITNCIFTACIGGMYNYSSNPTVTNCIFIGNNGSGMSNGQISRPIVTDCMFIANSARNGGGMFNYHGCDAIVTNCIFMGNVAPYNGGGMRNYRANPMVTNCIFIRNSANTGGGIWNGHGVACLISNCTFVGNSADENGGAICNWFQCRPTLSNCILRGNSAEEGPQIALDGGDLYVSYCNVQGGVDDVYLNTEEDEVNLIWLEGNIDADPCFADADNDDYHLQSRAGRWDPVSQSWLIDAATSPCIDAGNPGCPLGDEPNDPNNVRINMGAYGGAGEASKTPANWASLADLTNDRKVDSNDLAVFVRYWLESDRCISADLSRNESVDFSDFALFADEWFWEQ